VDIPLEKGAGEVIHFPVDANAKIKPGQLVVGPAVNFYGIESGISPIEEVNNGAPVVGWENFPGVGKVSPSIQWGLYWPGEAIDFAP
jgi:hypothetical protein